MLDAQHMSDLFHEHFAVETIAAITRVMAAANWNVFQTLTKRARRMAELLNGELSFAAECPHIWWGTTVENRHSLSRIDHLRSIPSPQRFLSIEPLLEDIGQLDLSGIGWVIVGGESGPGARPIDRSWVRSIRDQCLTAGIPFMFKQWGGVRKKTAGCVLDGQEWKQFPVFTRCPVPSRKERQQLQQQLCPQQIIASDRSTAA
jgi:protein gp37